MGSEPVHALHLADGADAPAALVREGGAGGAYAGFGSYGSMDADQTGLYVWGASLVLGRWLASSATARAELAGAEVVELGAGCGVPGLAAALHGRARRVRLTDLHAPTLANLRAIAGLNAEAAGACALEVERLDWAAPLALPPVAVVLGADLVYDDGMAALLAPLVAALVAPGGAFYYAYPFAYPSPLRDGVEDFCERLVAAGFALETDTTAPESLLTHPCRGAAGRAAGAHLHQLLAEQFRLQCYRKRPDA
jgi:hypothetical protein